MVERTVTYALAEGERPVPKSGAVTVAAAKSERLAGVALLAGLYQPHFVPRGEPASLVVVGSDIKQPRSLTATNIKPNGLVAKALLPEGSDAGVAVASDALPNQAWKRDGVVFYVRLRLPESSSVVHRLEELPSTPVDDGTGVRKSIVPPAETRGVPLANGDRVEVKATEDAPGTDWYFVSGELWDHLPVDVDAPPYAALRAKGAKVVVDTDVERVDARVLVSFADGTAYRGVVEVPGVATLVDLLAVKYRLTQSSAPPAIVDVPDLGDSAPVRTAGTIYRVADAAQALADRGESAVDGDVVIVRAGACKGWWYALRGSLWSRALITVPTAATTSVSDRTAAPSGSFVGAQLAVADSVAVQFVDLALPVEHVLTDGRHVVVRVPPHFKCFGAGEAPDQASCVKRGGTWDADCTTNADCPFFDPLRGRGGCSVGACEMPLGVDRAGPRTPMPGQMAMCHGCPADDPYCCPKVGYASAVFDGERIIR